MKSKKALITGASRGIGKACALAFSQAGYDCILTCKNNIESLNEYANELSAKFNVSCKAVKCDVSSSAEVATLYNDIDELDVLINNAGISHIGLLSDMSDDEWNNIMSTNLNSIFYTCRAAIPIMLRAHKGSIINISSVWGQRGASMEVAYSASKGGVDAFTKALAKELAISNITVNAVSCGLIDTDMNSHLSTEELDDVINEIPADRIGQPAEIADIVLKICESPSYLTGQIIGVDGGWR